MKDLLKRIIYLPKSLLNFFKLTFEELKKVSWLSRKQTLKYTLIVVLLIILSAGAILLLDKTFLFLRNLVI